MVRSAVLLFVSILLLIIFTHVQPGEIPTITSARAADTTVTISKVTPFGLNTSNPTLAIEGTNFGGSPSVYMGVSGGGMIQLTVLSASSNFINAQLTGATSSPGTYVLIVSKGTPATESYRVYSVNVTLGAVGATGPEGATGATGPQGLEGRSGHNGATGPSGPAGAPGPSGPSGPGGPGGPVGLTGPAGPTGAPGATGPSGPAGAGGILSSGVPNSQATNFNFSLSQASGSIPFQTATVMPTPCTASLLAVYTNVTQAVGVPATGWTYDFAVTKKGTNTNLACRLTWGSTPESTATCFNTDAAVPFEPGDVWYIHAQTSRSGTPPVGRVTASFVCQ